jgi:hypothetical protein
MMARMTTRIGDFHSTEARATRILEAARSLGYPMVCCNGGTVNNNAGSWLNTVRHAAPGVLLELEQRLAEHEAASRRSTEQAAQWADEDQRRDAARESCAQASANDVARRLGLR